MSTNPNTNFQMEPAPAPHTLGSQLPTDLLEVRAAEQRRRLHNTVAELRDTVRERVDVKRNAREHLLPAMGLAAVFGMVMGYGTAGIFVP